MWATLIFYSPEASPIHCTDGSPFSSLNINTVPLGKGVIHPSQIGYLTFVCCKIHQCLPPEIIIAKWSYTQHGFKSIISDLSRINQLTVVATCYIGVYRYNLIFSYGI